MCEHVSNLYVTFLFWSFIHITSLQEYINLYTDEWIKKNIVYM